MIMAVGPHHAMLNASISSQGGMGEEEELELVTAPIKGRHSGLRIILTHQSSPWYSTSVIGGGGEITQAKTTSDASHPDFGIYADPAVARLGCR